MARTNLFCCGLLMRGMRYHDSHLAGAFSSVRPATAPGRLLHLS